MSVQPDGRIYNDQLRSVSFAPGYRDIGMQVELNDGVQSKQIELRFDDVDAQLLLHELLDAFELAWRDESGPIDKSPGEIKPKFITLWQAQKVPHSEWSGRVIR
jgi:hypothetical protein